MCMSMCLHAAGDIRLDLRGTDLLITGKQGMTGGHRQALILPYDLPGYTASSAGDVCRQQNGLGQPVTCWDLQSPLQAA